MYDERSGAFVAPLASFGQAWMDSRGAPRGAPGGRDGAFRGAYQSRQKHHPEPAQATYDTRKRDPDTRLQARTLRRSHGAHPTRTSATLSAQPSPYRAHADASHTDSRQISPSPPTTAHMKIALSTAAPEQRTCIDVGHGLHALLGVQVADSRGMERNFDQLCTADATSAYCERSTHSSVLRSSIEASAQLAMVLLCQAGDRAASHWPMDVVSR